MIAEADADRRIICDLIDRKIQAHAPDWWDEGTLAAEREYCGLEPGTTFTRWTQLRNLPSPEGALRRGGSFIGFGQRLRLHSDYPLGRKALAASVLAKPRVDAVILVRDMDDEAEARRTSLHEVRAAVPDTALTVVLALPCTKREAWVLNGFEPQNAAEESALASVREELSFDPLTKAEELHATAHGAKRDAKRVLARLVGDDHTREARCWQETAWLTLRVRGTGSGLTAFLTEVKDRLVPLVTGQRG